MPTPFSKRIAGRGLERIHRIQQNAEEANRIAVSALAAFERVRSGNLDRLSASRVTGAIAELHADLRNYELGLREIEHRPRTAAR